MIYHFIVNDESLDTLRQNEKTFEDEWIPHHFKGFFNSSKEGIEFLLEKYRHVMQTNKISIKQFLEMVFITKIDGHICPTYKNLFKEFCNW